MLYRDVNIILTHVPEMLCQIYFSTSILNQSFLFSYENIENDRELFHIIYLMIYRNMNRHCTPLSLRSQLSGNFNSQNLNI